jgi:hypothetical protein
MSRTGGRATGNLTFNAESRRPNPNRASRTWRSDTSARVEISYETLVDRTECRPGGVLGALARLQVRHRRIHARRTGVGGGHRRGYDMLYSDLPQLPAIGEQL